MYFYFKLVCIHLLYFVVYKIKLALKKSFFLVYKMKCAFVNLLSNSIYVNYYKCTYLYVLWETWCL